MKSNVAEIDITPAFEVELSGFAAREHPSIGVLEPIYARALYLDDEKEKLLWIACDVIALEREFVEKFRAWAKRELKLQPRQVLLSATHTHNAPATIHLTGAGAYSANYVELLMERLQEVAKIATSESEPCEMLVGSTTLNLSIDRRNKPSAHVDPYVWAIAFQRPRDRSYIGAAMNYTMHPVTLGGGERRISPDWCGAAASTFSMNLRGAPVTLVSNGAAGNINPPQQGVPPQQVREWGQQVGRAALAAIKAATPQTEPALKVKSISVAVPLDWHDEAKIDAIADKKIAEIQPGWMWEQQFRAAVTAWRKSLKTQVAAGKAREVDIELQVARIGDAFIVAVNGEMFTRFTDIVRQKTGKNLFTVAYANSAFGYIPTREAYPEGGYEVETAHFFYNSFRPKAGGLELLADRAAELINSF